jgi:hypothetical protein
MSQKELLSFYQKKKKKSDEFYSGLLSGRSVFDKKNRNKSAAEIRAAETTTPRAITPTTPPEATEVTPTTPAAATPTTTTETAATIPMVLIDSEESDSRKKQKTAAGAEKLYSDGNVSKVFENVCKYTKILKLMHNSFYR